MEQDSELKLFEDKKNFDKLLKFGWQRNKSLVIYNKFELFFIKYIAKI